MSDFEDDMDVDAPAVQDAITFSSDRHDKGKRSAANLPVEAEDSLPWYVQVSCVYAACGFLSNLGHCRVEKYRPSTLDDVSGHQDILATITKFVDNNVRPHILSLAFVWYPVH